MSANPVVLIKLANKQTNIHRQMQNPWLRYLDCFERHGRGNALLILKTRSKFGKSLLSFHHSTYNIHTTYVANIQRQIEVKAGSGPVTWLLFYQCMVTFF